MAGFILMLFPAVVAFWYLLGDFFAKTAGSDASKARAALMNQVDRLAFDIDLELSLLDSYLMAGNAIRIDGDVTRGDTRRSVNQAPFMKAILSYAETTRWPGLVKAVYLVEKVGGSLSSTRLLPDDDSPDAFAASVETSYADILSEDYRPPAGSDGLMTRAAWLRGRRNGSEKTRLIVAVLDEALMVETIVPTLAGRYFGKGSGFDDYIVTVTDPTGRIRFSTGKENGRTPDFSRSLIRDNSRFDIARFYADFMPRYEESGKVAPPPPPKDDKRLAMPSLPRPGLPRPAPGDVPYTIDQYRFQGSEPGGVWSVSVYGKAASIEAVAARQTILWWMASAGFLAVLYGSIVMLYLSSRRASELAHRERDFVASVTHELKTPIAVALSAGENLAKGIVPPDRVGAYGAMVADEARRLGDSVERLLVMAGIESSMSFRNGERMTVAELFGRAASTLARTAAQRGATLELAGGGELTIEGSRMLLESAVECVIGNAILYAGGAVRVEGRRSGRGKRRFVTIACADSGPGVPWRERRRLFEPFYRGVAATSAAVRGTGIGLYLARRVARLHGGDARLRFPAEGGLVVELSFRSR